MTTRGTIRWNFEDGRQCCERPSVDVNFDLNSLKGEDLIWYYLSVIDYPNIEYSKAILIFHVNTESKTIIFRNYHNGYCPHNLDIYENNVLKYNVSI